MAVLPGRLDAVGLGYGGHGAAAGCANVQSRRAERFYNDLRQQTTCSFVFDPWGVEMPGSYIHGSTTAGAARQCLERVRTRFWVETESGTSWGRLRGDWCGVGCSAEGWVPAVEVVGELVVEDSGADLQQ